MIIAPILSVVKRETREKNNEDRTKFKKPLDKSKNILYHCVSEVIHFWKEGENAWNGFLTRGDR